MKYFFSLVALLIAAFAVKAAERQEIALTPDSAAMLYIFRAPNPVGMGVVGCPGGAYAGHAIGHEGFDFADWFNSRGIDYAVLRYRLPEGRNTIPSDDGFKAIAIMKGIAPKVGVMGFSAGGHLASTLATHYYDSVSRPDFQILFYPVITMEKGVTHPLTRQKLIGASTTDDLIERYSNELQVRAGNPPAMIFYSADDDVVPLENGLRYCQALADHGVPVNMEIFPDGGHGWGFLDRFPYKPVWTARLSQWLTDMQKSLGL